MKIAPQRLVFIDETWIKTNMAPLRGWAPRGKRLRAYAPFGHWKTLTFIAALRCDRIDAHGSRSSGPARRTPSTERVSRSASPPRPRFRAPTP